MIGEGVCVYARGGGSVSRPIPVFHGMRKACTTKLFFSKLQVKMRRVSLSGLDDADPFV